MASSLLQWESDPLFSAAEVVQDSADRMESIFRLLVHELTLVQGDQTDPKLLASINYHRRDLATTLETAKWQLEDFERAVSLSAVTDKSKMREDVISRNRQFIRAIREQIIQVEKSLEEASIGYPIKNADWINLNEDDRDGLALFLSGGSPSKSSSPYELEDSGILRRFLDPTTASSSQDNTSHNFEIKSIKVDNLNMNEVVHVNHNFGSMGNNLRNMDSCFSSQLGESRDNLLETYCNGYGEDGNWDLEVNQTKPQNGFHENKLRRFRSRNNIFGFFGNLWTAYESPFTRNYIKRLKDGEEQAHSTTGTDVLNDGQSWLGTCRVAYQRWTHYVQVNRHSFRLTLSIIFTLIILGMLVSRMA
ncbi:uncharacterized protein LOC107432220 [Ziziphus jujuba]|uniref:Uncharacterized protein LOC107432220 n=1 Tax=Ziziphus jujuba TaxID=326968 RepID=A0A6P4ATA4_ZIZJJ|nr:uncharacterized protein LOC107432220 [Ziziphus jujuba]